MLGITRTDLLFKNEEVTSEAEVVSNLLHLQIIAMVEAKEKMVANNLIIMMATTAMATIAMAEVVEVVTTVVGTEANQPRGTTMISLLKVAGPTTTETKCLRSQRENLLPRWVEVVASTVPKIPAVKTKCVTAKKKRRRASQTEEAWDLVSSASIPKRGT